MDDEELRSGYFQQDNAPPHVSNTVITFLSEFFEERLMSRNLWPPRSPDLSPLDFCIFGYIKDKVFRSRLHTLQELREKILEVCNTINEGMLERIFENMKRRVNICIEAEGGHFEHLL